MKRLVSWLSAKQKNPSDIFGAYLDGELSESERRAFETEVLRSGEQASQRLEELRLVRTEVRDWFEETAAREARERPLDVWQNIEQVIRADIRSRAFTPTSSEKVAMFFRRLSDASVLRPQMLGVGALACAMLVFALTQSLSSEKDAQMVARDSSPEIQVAQLDTPHAKADTQLIGGLSEQEADDLLARVGFGSPRGPLLAGAPVADSLADRIVAPMMASVGGRVSGGLRSGGVDIEWIETERPFRIMRSGQDANPPVIWVARAPSRAPLR